MRLSYPTPLSLFFCVCLSCCCALVSVSLFSNNFSFVANVSLLRRSFLFAKIRPALVAHAVQSQCRLTENCGQHKRRRKPVLFFFAYLVVWGGSDRVRLLLEFAPSGGHIPLYIAQGAAPDDLALRDQGFFVYPPVHGVCVCMYWEFHPWPRHKPLARLNWVTYF